jgi:hypothetical protein
MIRSRALIVASGAAAATLLVLRLAGAAAFAGPAPGLGTTTTVPWQVAPMDAMCLELPAGNPPLSARSMSLPTSNPPPCRIPVVLRAPRSVPVVVHIATQDQTAHAPSNYLPVRDEVLQFPPGSTSATAVVDLTPQQHAGGPDLTFQLIVFNPTPQLPVGPPATVTISWTGT